MQRSLNPFEPQFARIHSGELRLRAPKEASSLPMLPLKPALDGWTVMRNARERVEVLGGPAAVRNYKNVLSQHILQFGKYRGQTFKWVLENDLGWVTGVLATVACAGEKEEGTPLSQNKFRLLQYVKMYPMVHEILKEKEAKRRVEKSLEDAKPRKVSMPATATRPSQEPHLKTDVMEDRDLAAAVREIETMEILSGDVVYSTWKQVLDPCDLKWISKALFRVNQQGKPEMCFDVIDHMWYHPPSPPLVCTQVYGHDGTVYTYYGCEKCEKPMTHYKVSDVSSFKYSVANGVSNILTSITSK